MPAYNVKSNSGETKISTIILVLALIIGAYVVIKIAPAYIHNFQIESTVRSAAKFQADPTKRLTVISYIRAKIQDMELPVEVEDFELENDEETARVSITWTYEVVFIPENSIVPSYARYITFHDEAIEKIKR